MAIAGLWFSVLGAEGAPVEPLPAAPKPPPGAITYDGYTVNPGRVLVGWKEGSVPPAATSRVEQALRTEDARVLGVSPTRVRVESYPTIKGVGLIEFDDAAAAQAALAAGSAATTSAASGSALQATQLKGRIAALEASGLFAYVEPDYIQYATATPSDAAFGDGRLWGLRNLGQSGGVSGIDTQAVTAWDLSTGSSSVIVAVIDTGIRYTHRDLASNMWHNPGEIAGNGVDDDGNGYVDDVFGINAITNSGDPLDDNGHGSHCSGTIAGSANDIGELVGVAWFANVMGLKFLSAQGGGNTSDAIKCIDYAISKGAHIISGSYGGGGFSQATSAAIDRARVAGILCIFAAGNESNNNDLNPAYPASYPQNNIVSVAAIDRTGALANFSNFGATSVDLAAPGVQIFSCTSQSDSAYAEFSGTSMATPHVAGVAALLKARNFGDSYTVLRERLLGSTRPLPALQGKVATGGMVQARAAMELSADGTMEVSLSVNPTPLKSGEPATLTVRVTDLTPVTNATVTGTIGTTSIVFKNDGIAPDTRAGDELYSARVTVPANTGATASVAISATAQGKAPFSGTVTVPVVSRPANDGFASAATLDLSAVPLQASNLECSRETGEPAHAGNTGGRSVWWNWTAPSPGQLQLSTAGSSFDTLLAVYTGSAVNGLAPVASNDDAGVGNLTSAVQFNATSGTTYRIAVDGFGGASGNIVLNATFTSTGAGNTPPAFARQPASLRVQQGETIRLTVEVTGNPAPGLQWLKDGIAIANGGRISGAQSAELVIASAEAVDGGNYTVTASNAVGTATSLAAIVTVDVALVRPPNDDFAQRSALVGSSAQATGVNTGATAEAGEPAHAARPARRSVWWTWSAPETGAVAIDTFGSAFDTVLAVYRGAQVSGLTSVAANDDASGTRQSRVTFTAEAGVLYAIAVDSAGDESGSITLRLNQGASDGSPPTITRQPVGTPVLEGFGTDLIVVATGEPPLTYQWWHNGAPIEGANHPLLSIESSQPADGGSYFVVVFNAFGSVTSNTVTLTVNATGRPPNDDFAAGAPIAPGGELGVARLTGATRENGERHHGTPASEGGTMWWRWRPAASGLATISTDGSISEAGDTLDTVLAVYTGNALNALTLVGENDDIDASGGNFNSEVTFFATAGTTYHIAVGGYDVDDVGIIILDVPAAAAPVSNSAPVVLLHPLSLTLAVGESATYIIGASGAPHPAIQWQRSVDGGANWSNLANGGDIAGAQSIILFVSDAREEDNGRLFRARLSNTSGTVVSNPAILAVLPRPANDDFSAALPIPSGLGLVTGSNIGATGETGEPSHADVGTGSVWWTWQAPFTGATALDTVGSDFDTVLAVYTGNSVGQLTEVASDDDFGDSRQSKVEFSATAGTTYRIAVAGYFGDFGAITLRLPTDLVPALTAQPPAASQVTDGGTITISAAAVGSPAPAFRWQRSVDGGGLWSDLSDDATFAGTATQTLVITGATAQFNGQMFRVVATNDLGAVVSSPSTLSVTQPAVQLANLSTRAISQGGNGVIIPGFVLSGSTSKRVLIRAVGPKLADFGVSGVLPDPVLSIFRQGEAQPLASNDNWVTQEPGRLSPADVAVQVGAFALTASPGAPTNDTSSAALVLDLTAGAYSTVARDSQDRTGVGIVEIYDAGSGGSKLANVSNRGFVGLGSQVMIPGFVVEGSGARRYLIRAVGPKLADFGLPAGTLLADPVVSVVRDSVTIASNDNWVVQSSGSGGTSADLQIIAGQVGAFAMEATAELPTDDQKSAALIVWLEPGAYTVVVSGAGGGTGVAIAEVYEVP